MRILFHSWEFGPGTGGIGQYFYQMARGVTKLGHDVIIVTGRECNEPERLKSDFGVVYRLYEKNQLRTPFVSEKVLNLAGKYKVDFIEGADHLGECAGLINRPDRPPILIKYHSCQFLEKISRESVLYFWQVLTIRLAALRIRKQIQAEKVCVENADCVIAPSKRIFQAYREQGAVIPGKSSVIPNILAEVPGLQGGMEATRPTLLFVGRIEVLKGIQYLPRILRSIRQYYPNVVLEIAGSDQYARGLGSLKNWLARKMEDMKDNVCFLGALSSEELDKAYRRCWVLVFPTKWDNFPMAVLEAMAYAKPVVTTLNGGMPEILAGTGAPVAAPDSKEFLESIIQLLGNKPLRRQIGEACRQKVLDNYMPEQVVPQYLEFLESFVCDR